MRLTREQALRVLESADLVCASSEVTDALERMSREISAALANSFPIVFCVMRGAVIFSGHLLPRLRFPLELEYLDVTRYGDAIRGGEIVWNVAPGPAVAGREILVLDDVLDEGRTLAAIRDKLLAGGARRVLSAVFADKRTGRPRPFEPDFTGVDLPDRYLFGFGMDVHGLWRNLPDIYALSAGSIRNEA